MRSASWAVLVLMAVSVTLPATLASPRVEARVRFDAPFVVMALKVENVTSATLTLDLGNYSERLVYHFAVAKGSLVETSLNGTLLKVDTGGASSIEVWAVLRTLKVEGERVLIDLPSPLVPLEANESVYTLLLYDLPAQPTALPPSPLNISSGYNETLRYYATGAAKVKPGPAGNLTLDLGFPYLPPALAKVERTLEVDSLRTVLIDNLTLVGLGSRQLANISLEYPAHLRVEGVGGLLGPYPPASYTVSYRGNRTLVTIRLLAPPHSPGDVAYVWVKLSCPTLLTDGSVRLPALMSIGRFVENLTVTLRVRGELEGLGRGEAEDSCRVYRLPSRKLLGGEVDPYLVLRGRLLPPPQPNYAALAALLVAFASLGYVAARPRRGTTQRPVVSEVRVTSELLNVLRERKANVEELARALDDYATGRLSAPLLRRVISRYKQREAMLRRRAREVAQGEGESVLLGRVDELLSRVDRCLSDLAEIHEKVRRGFVSEREKRDTLRSIVEELWKIRSEIESLLES